MQLFPKQYQSFADSTHGRVVYHPSYSEPGLWRNEYFDPYLMRSEVKKNQIQKEKGLKKFLDNSFFQLNKISGFQCLVNDLVRIKDFESSKKLPVGNSAALSQLQGTMRQKRPTPLRMTGAMTQMIASVATVGLAAFVAGDMFAGSLLDSYENERNLRVFKWRSETLRTAEGRRFVDKTLRESSEEREADIVENRECSFCYSSLKDRYGGAFLEKDSGGQNYPGKGYKNYFMHCKKPNGEFGDNAALLCKECAKEEFKRQHQASIMQGISGPRHFSEIKCPACSQPYISDQQLIQQFGPPPPSRTFREFVKAKCVDEPLAKVTNVLSRQIPQSLSNTFSRGYQALTNADDGAEMVPLRRPHWE
jgi:hypothetical protein